MLYKLLLASAAPAVVFGAGHADGGDGHDHDHATASDEHDGEVPAEAAQDEAHDEAHHDEDGPQHIQLNWVVTSQALAPMTLCVGDTVTFKWVSGFHDVWKLEGGQDDYDNCVMPSNAYTLLADGQQPIAPLDVQGEADYVVQAGTEYFSCSVVGHCEEGQKVMITGVEGPDCVRVLGSAVGGEHEAPAHDDHSGHDHSHGTDDEDEDEGAGNGNGSVGVFVGGIFASVAAALMF